MPEVPEALGDTKATVVFVTSIMTKRSETSGFTRHHSEKLAQVVYRIIHGLV